VFAWLGLFAQAPQDIMIDGRHGDYFTHIGGPESTTTVVAWTNGDTDFILTGERVDQPTLVAAAGSVRQATTQQWQALVSANPIGGG
jgi:hypothetical protein